MVRGNQLLRRGQPSRHSRLALKNILAHSFAFSRSSRVPPENSNRPSWHLRSRHDPKLAINSASRAGPGSVEGCLMRWIKAILSARLCACSVRKRSPHGGDSNRRGWIHPRRMTRRLCRHKFSKTSSSPCCEQSLRPELGIATILPQKCPRTQAARSGSK